jgi:short-subunit dehydrogenase
LTICLADGQHYWRDDQINSYKTFEINALALIKITRLAIKQFLKQELPGDGSLRGVIVNTSSIAGVTAIFPTPVYAASKWG